MLANDGGTSSVETGATLYVTGAVQNNATGTLTNAGTLQLTTFSQAQAWRAPVGRTLSSQTVALPLGTSTLSLAAANMASGVYLVQVQQGKHHQAIKLVRE